MECQTTRIFSSIFSKNYPAVEPPSENSKFPLAIHESNDYSTILNKDAIIFSDYGEKQLLDELNEIFDGDSHKEKYFITEEQITPEKTAKSPEKITQQIHEQPKKSDLPRIPKKDTHLPPFGDDDDDEQSILVQKLQDLVVKFEKEMDRYLTPDIPTGRKERKKYLMERELFATVGYKEFVRAIKLKVKAVCTYEDDFDIEMFDGKISDNENDQEKENDEKFATYIAKAIDGDFQAAIAVVNAVEQIVMAEELGSPRRRLLTKIQ